MQERLKAAELQPSLGISHTLDNELKSLGYACTTGMLIVQTWRNGPAHKAGLLQHHGRDASVCKRGDVITHIDGIAVSTRLGFIEVMGKMDVGKEVELRVSRSPATSEEDEELVVNVTLSNARAAPDLYNIPQGQFIRVRGHNPTKK